MSVTIVVQRRDDNAPGPQTGAALLREEVEQRHGAAAAGLGRIRDFVMAHDLETVAAMTATMRWVMAFMLNLLPAA